jgi:hypothetical protein
MIDSEILGIALCALSGVTVSVELIVMLPLTQCAHNIIINTKKSISVIKSPNISDNWKEKALPCYSKHLLVSSLAITFFY